jgi:hypothetical protein
MAGALQDVALGRLIRLRVKLIRIIGIGLTWVEPRLLDRPRVTFVAIFVLLSTALVFQRIDIKLWALSQCRS